MIVPCADCRYPAACGPSCHADEIEGYVNDIVSRHRSLFSAILDADKSARDAVNVRAHGTERRTLPMQRQCSIPDCNSPHRGRGWCNRHWLLWRRYGDPLTRRNRSYHGLAALDKFFQYVTFTPTCWLWIGGKNDHGYGTFHLADRTFLAHRWLYRQLRCEVPKSLHLDHLCFTPHCVNVFDHIEPVPPLINVRRAAARITHCPQGHAYDEPNTYYYPRGGRLCRACHRDQERIRRARKLVRP